jgi:uncharacterized membrane protein
VTVTLKPFSITSRNTVRVPRHAAPARSRELALYAGALMLVAALVPLDRYWAIQVLLLIIVLIVPGVILLRALRVPGHIVSSFPVYIPCASIIVLFSSGLAVDLLGPLLGVKAPIRAGPLLISLEIICAALLALSRNAPSNVDIQWSSLGNPVRFVWPLIVPLIAAAGALRLNSGHGNGIALAALSASIVMIIVAVIFSFKTENTLLAVILYATELATMWSFSLRSDLVYGFDISTEYYDMHRAVLTGIWSTAHPGDPYGAMLSITVLPAELHFLSGVPDLMVLKLVYPVISALLPVGVFGLARRVLSRRWAFAAAAAIVMQASFAQELPALARQQIALLFFIAVVMAMFDRRLHKRSQLTLVALLSLAMVLSHYSTTYVAILLFGLTLLLQWVTSWLRRIPHMTGAIAVAFIVSLSGAVLWYGPVTHSATGLSQFAKTVNTAGLNLLPNRSLGENSFAAYLGGNTQTPISAEQYARQVATEYVSNDRFITPLTDAGQYPLRNSAPPVPPVRWKAGYTALRLGPLIVQQLVYLLSAVGCLMMILRRRASVVTRHIGLLALSALLFLAMIRLSGTLAFAYNQERALLQAMTVLAIPLCWPLRHLAGRGKHKQAQIVVVAALVILFIGTSGMLGAIMGGGTTANLTNSGEDFDRFYITVPELASARWLGQFLQRGQTVYADRYAQLPLVAMTGISRGLFNDVTPNTLNKHAWVYAGASNVIDGQARALFNDQNTVTYVFPSDFLDANYNLVYTNGSSEVFHR